MNGYTKLFVRILDSTIWQEDNPTRILWITMLAMVDRDGLVLASIPGLAKRANITLPECEAALAKFQEPDPYSQSQVAEGRRIEVVPGGWHLINYASYRHQLSAEEQREKDRLRKAQYRMSQNLSRVVPDCPTLSQTVPPSPAESDIAAVAVSATVTEKEKSKARGTFVPPTLEEVRDYCKERNNGIDAEKFLYHYESVGWRKNGGNQIKNWRAAVITWEKNNFGGPFRDGYQKTGRTERSQLGTQAQRALNNIRAVEAAFMGPDSGPNGPGQAPRSGGRDYPLLEGKAEKLP